MKRPFSLCYFNSKDALKKKTSKPRIRAEMLDNWEDVKRIIKACPTLLRSSELSWLAGYIGVEKTRELVVKKW